MTIRAISENDRENIRQFMRRYWGSDQMVSRGKLHRPPEQAGFLAEKDGPLVGLITYEIADGQMEITLLDSRERNQGLGTALVERVIEEARRLDCPRVWLITTNDNIRAIQFYQKRGFDLVGLHYNAMELSRKLKPGIPETGFAGIPIRHELEFAYRLGW